MSKYRHVEGLLLLIFTALWVSQPAWAGFNACNKTQKNISVAIGYLQDGHWRSSGWYTVDPSKCTELLSGDLDNKYYYTYAERSDGTTWSAPDSDQNGGFCVKNPDAFDFVDDNCQGGESKHFQTVDVEDADDFEEDFTLGSEPEIKTAVVHQQCLMSWDDSFQIHSTHLVIRWNYQTLKTTMKKLHHCIQLTVTGPIDAAGVAKDYVNYCVDYALNKDKTQHILEGIIALGADILSEGSSGGSATAAAVTEYINSVRENALDCLTDQEKIQSFVAQQLSAKLDATVQNESHWVYWDL
jgi:uncharacterized membrane protein